MYPTNMISWGLAAKNSEANFLATHQTSNDDEAD
jgi:hypothetical protein